MVKMLGCYSKLTNNLAKLHDGIDKSPTVMVGDRKQKQKLGKNRGILKPSWAFIETNRKRNIYVRSRYINHINGLSQVASNSLEIIV
jgi:hypothetical protein